MLVDEVDLLVTRNQQVWAMPIAIYILGYAIEYTFCTQVCMLELYSSYPLASRPLLEKIQSNV